MPIHVDNVLVKGTDTKAISPLIRCLRSEFIEDIFFLNFLNGSKADKL